MHNTSLLTAMLSLSYQCTSVSFVRTWPLKRFVESRSSASRWVMSVRIIQNTENRLWYNKRFYLSHLEPIKANNNTPKQQTMETTYYFFRSVYCICILLLNWCFLFSLTWDFNFTAVKEQSHTQQHLTQQALPALYCWMMAALQTESGRLFSMSTIQSRSETAYLQICSFTATFTDAVK